MDDVALMRAALALARRGLGVTWPNPSVGCVVVGADGRVVGRGVTGEGGRPHAEALALAAAGGAARAGCAYVTLEPCSHFGVTPPCADALVAAGVARVVVGCGDPDARVSGRGVARLRAAGVEVVSGVLAGEARAVAAGFLSRVERGRPVVTLKLASSLDGRIATRAGDSRWITGAEARRAGHALRASHDAVMCGVGTVLADDPALTCRLEGARARAVVRVVADSALRTPAGARLVATAGESPTWVLHRARADGGVGRDGEGLATRAAALRAAGVVLVAVADAGGAGVDGAADGDGPGDEVAGRVDLAAGLRALGGMGLTRVLVEGGGRLAAGLLRAGLVDRVAWFHAPGVVGGDGVAAVAAMGLERIAGMARFVPAASRFVGVDVLTELVAVAGAGGAVPDGVMPGGKGAG